jgi:glycosyltransferase involved in cell wall biosynthesis
LNGTNRLYACDNNPSAALNAGIGVATFPLMKSGVVPLTNLTKILAVLSDNVHVITGNEGEVLSGAENGHVHFQFVTHRIYRNRYLRIFSFIYTLIKISLKVAATSSRVKYWFFFLGEGSLLLPMITAKLFGKKVALISAASEMRISTAQVDLYARVLELLENTNRILAHKIIVYSPSIIEEWNLNRYKSKILIAHEHFLDSNKTYLKTKIDKRELVVGYIGRFSQEKGILNFIKAIPLVRKQIEGIRFVLGGEGALTNEIKEYLRENELGGSVNLLGWINHEVIEESLNTLKLLVVPSATEGLPNIILEAMACGTPVLATKVGAIPDYIVDSQTGFLLEDNSPECIARNILRCLNFPNLNQISNNGMALTKQYFTFDKAIDLYKDVLNSF